jgi:two-component system, OmpR family, sensor histidine kinase KdpD
MNLKKLQLLSRLNGRGTSHKKHYISDSLLALGSIFSVTGFISLFHLYPKIPDSFLVYLLIILALAGLRGLYASLLASFLAFFLFDFLFIAPVYSLTVAKLADILTLIAFLITAILTSQLTSALRRRAEDASHREHETRMLYDILRTTNREEDVRHQLTILARSIIEVYSSPGIRDCAFLLPHTENEFTLQASAYIPIEQIQLSPDEPEHIQWVLSHGEPLKIEDPTGALSTNAYPLSTHRQIGEKKLQMRRSLWLIPLKTEQQVIGILRLNIEEDAKHPVSEQGPGKEYDYSTSQSIFFSAFLEQAVTIIERGRLRNESLQAKLLQKTDALRSALLSSVSHDLRTPLATIKTSVTSLQQKGVEWNEDARQSFISAIERETDRLNGLVENLLDMSRIEAGALQPEKVWYPLDELVHDVLDRMSEQLRGRNVKVDISDTLPPVEIDSVEIDQVITNIIENAIHHTPNGSPIDVSIHCTEKQVCVSIADRGPGVLPAERERIFDKFYRVLGDPPVTTYSRGSGLGLAICRALIEAHGGQIWVEARAGGGAIFQFTLPLNKLEDCYEQTESKHSDS